MLAELGGGGRHQESNARSILREQQTTRTSKKPYGKRRGKHKKPVIVYELVDIQCICWYIYVFIWCFESYDKHVCKQTAYSWEGLQSCCMRLLKSSNTVHQRWFTKDASLPKECGSDFVFLFSWSRSVKNPLPGVGSRCRCWEQPLVAIFCHRC